MCIGGEVLCFLLLLDIAQITSRALAELPPEKRACFQSGDRRVTTVTSAEMAGIGAPYACTAQTETTEAVCGITGNIAQECSRVVAKV